MGNIIIGGSTTAPVDQYGVLSGLVQQVSDISPTYTEDQGTYVCKYKGPYKVLKDANLLVNKQLMEALRSLSVNTKSCFSSPTPPAGTNWWVVGTKLEELEAGDHAILTITCEARDQNYGQMDAVEDPYADTWQMRWESYTLKPTAFCSNKPHYDYSLTDPSVQEGQPLSGYASREHIDYFLNGNDKGVAKGHRWYRDDQGQGWYLNDAENFVVNKALEDKSALWHYPVLTHTTVQNTFVNNISAILSNNVKYNTVIGDKIDYIVGGSAAPADKPDGCPYSFPDSPKWMWVKTGDDMQHVKTKGKISFQRTETYMGVISADLNYYGDIAFDHTNLSACRWQPGAL